MPRKPPETSHKNKSPVAMSGLWSITPTAHQELIQRMASIDWNVADNTKWDQRETKIEGGVAIIPVIGTITKYADFYDRFWGAVSAEWLVSEIEKANTNQSVKRIVLLIDSGGGRVDGTTLVVEAVGRCSKRIDAAVSGYCCSAAYWVASQCTSISANAIAEVGSIGVFMVGTDESQFWNDIGITFHVVSSGGVKGAGFDGKFPDELKAEWQRSVDDCHNTFLSAVSKGRGLTIEDARRLGDGRTYRAAESVSLKLIDRVSDANAAIDTIIKEVITMTQQEFQQAAAANPTWTEPFAASGYEKAKAEFKPKHATADELKEAFSKDADFIVARIGTGATLAEHKAAYADHLVGKLAAANTTIDGLKAEVAKHDPATAGVAEPVATPTQTAGSKKSPLAAAVDVVNADFDRQNSVSQ